MSWTVFWGVYMVSILIVVLQGWCSWLDGYFSHNQIVRLKKPANAYSILQHGGMWGDILIIAWVMGLVVSLYLQFPYPLRDCAFALAAIGMTIAFGIGWAKDSLVTPEAHAHDGRQTAAGIIHLPYFAVGYFLSAHVFFGTAPGTVRPLHAWLIAIGLAIHVVLGVWKFNHPGWKLKTKDKLGVLAQWVGIGFGLWRLVG